MITNGKLSMQDEQMAYAELKLFSGSGLNNCVDILLLVIVFIFIINSVIII